MQKSIEKSMPFEIDFCREVGGFWEGKWRQVGTQIDQKSMPIAKSDFLKNRALAAAGARFLRFWASKLGVKIDQKTESKMDGILASIFLDFDRFWEASWGGNWSQERPKKASKNDAKKKSAS